MLLFLDTISPIPEFCVIDDNKVILKEKIIQNELLIDEKKSKDLLEKYKSVRLAIENGKKNK